MTSATAAPTVPAPHPVREFVRDHAGALRVIVVIAVIWTIFELAEPRFLTAVNLTNLVLQITAVGLISVGVVLVLLLGEIDLSIGAVSGLCSAIVAALNVKHGWSPYLAIAAGVLAGSLIGLFHGFMFDFFGIPSFVVTLAGLLAWQGFQLRVLGDTGTLNVTDPKLTGLAGTFYENAVGWIVAIGGTACFAGAASWQRRQRLHAGLPAASAGVLALRVSLAGIVAAGIVAVLEQDRGVPLAGLILFGFVCAFHYVTTRTRFGRHIYAIGGNAHAARRAGIPVRKVRVAVFALASSLAAVGGIMAASRLLAVNQSSGGSDLLLLAIAGPVVAGTSLFGGRGDVWTALLGAIVIGSISNGMDLLALESSVQFIVTGGVLLAAVVVDAVARRRSPTAG